MPPGCFGGDDVDGCGRISRLGFWEVAGERRVRSQISVDETVILFSGESGTRAPAGIVLAGEGTFGRRRRGGCGEHQMGTGVNNGRQHHQRHLASGAATGLARGVSLPDHSSRAGTPPSSICRSSAVVKRCSRTKLKKRDRAAGDRDQSR